MVDKFAVACYGLIFSNRNLLMVMQKSGLWANKWTLPGGLLKTGDSMESCIEREVFDRTSCRVKAKRQVMATPYNISGSVFERNILVVFYVCDMFERQPGVEQESSMAWVDRESFYRQYREGTVPVQVFNAVSKACPEKEDAWQLSRALAAAGPIVNGTKLIRSIKRPGMKKQVAPGQAPVDGGPALRETGNAGRCKDINKNA
ncbi:MAG: nucleoside triphosphate pyrophosphohydrolase [Methanocella sp. PtaU1.Bin125]|nr:MAG: nucleoside triphosphate pyrophosphohydrolase [Methanocella sp. PtaU1.Bin125]